MKATDATGEELRTYVCSENASYEAVDPTFRAHTLTMYVPFGRPVVFQVQVLVVLYARSGDHEVPLYNQNWYSYGPDPPLAAAENSHRCTRSLRAGGRRRVQGDVGGSACSREQKGCGGAGLRCCGGADVADIHQDVVGACRDSRCGPDPGAARTVSLPDGIGWCTGKSIRELVLVGPRPTAGGRSPRYGCSGWLRAGGAGGLRATPVAGSVASV